MSSNNASSPFPSDKMAWQEQEFFRYQAAGLELDPAMQDITEQWHQQASLSGLAHQPCSTPGMPRMPHPVPGRPIRGPPHPPEPHPPRAHLPPDGPTYSTTDKIAEAYYNHSSGARVSTDALIASRLRLAHPELGMTIVSMDRYPPLTSLLTYADATGEATYKALGEPKDPNSMPWTTTAYVPPIKRLDDGVVGGSIDRIAHFGRFEYHWKSHEFLVYLADGRDGHVYSPPRIGQYILHAATPEAENAAAELIRAIGSWQVTLHREIWVFDRGLWQKDRALYENVQKVSWDDVILDPKEKQMLQDDVTRFFDGRERYTRLRVPWKRGVIYHGPPGNGKTVSIKATMHTLYQRTPAVPTLYVRSFASFGGPEAGIKAVFDKARAEAPCLLIFEDLDALVTDAVRSYFLNEVDGLASNDGVMIVGSTNHLDRLDPGLSKRPSRFDRKFLFPKPSKAQRVRYADYWRGKLRDNEDIDFEKPLSVKIAEITDDFSFAYMQEAFVATLLVLASGDDDDDDDDKKGEEGKKSSDTTSTTRNGKMAVQEPSFVMTEEENGELVKIDDGREYAMSDSESDDEYDEDNDDGDDDKFKNNKFWQGFKKQVEILRSEM